MIATFLVALLSAADPQPEAPIYAAGQRVPIEFSLRVRDREGGRTTPLYTNYRPWISADRQSDRCEFHVPGGGGVRPGETRQIEMVCPFATRAGDSIEFFEVGRPIGRGVVLASSR